MLSKMPVREENLIRPLRSLSALCLAGAIMIHSAHAGEIVAGSTLIQGIIQDLAGDGWEVGSLIPGGMCPGHYDVRPSDVARLTGCRILILHEWQPAMANVRQAIRAADLSEDRIRVVSVRGSWMSPPVQAQAVEALARLWIELDPARQAEIEKRAAARCAEAAALSQRLKARLESAGVRNVTVLCNEQQVGFVEWAGFQVAATFGRPEDLSVAEVQRLMTRARQAQVGLVIDNLQSGERQIGETLARDAGVVPVLLSNFPGGFEGTDTWEKAVEHNVALLLDAVTQARNNHGRRCVSE